MSRGGGHLRACFVHPVPVNLDNGLLYGNEQCKLGMADGSGNLHGLIGGARVVALASATISTAASAARRV
jgi:hypothetical protein